MSPRIWRTFRALGFSPRPVLGPPLSCADWLPLTWVQSVWPQRQSKAEWGWGRCAGGGGGVSFAIWIVTDYYKSKWYEHGASEEPKPPVLSAWPSQGPRALPPSRASSLPLLCFVHDKQMFICFLFSFSGLLLMGMFEFCLIKDQLVLFLWLN